MYVQGYNFGKWEGVEKVRSLIMTRLDFQLSKWQEMVDQKPKGISKNIKLALSKDYSNLCKTKSPIKTLRVLTNQARELKEADAMFHKRLASIVGQSLQGTENGNEFMRKQELIDAQLKQVDFLVCQLWKEKGNLDSLQLLHDDIDNQGTGCELE